jgi:hypothetical protein
LAQHVCALAGPVRGAFSKSPAEGEWLFPRLKLVELPLGARLAGNELKEQFGKHVGMLPLPL